MEKREEDFEFLKKALSSKVELSDNEWEDLSSRWITLSFAKNEMITNLNEVEKYFYFVASGVQRAYFLRDGQEICVGFSFDHSYSGLYDSFITKSPSRFCLQAINDSRLLAITLPDLQAMYDKYKSIERWGRLFMEQMFLGKAYHEIAVLSYTAEERLQRLMNDSPRIFQLVPQKYLASYLGLAPETFSRLRKKLLSRS